MRVSRGPLRDVTESRPVVRPDGRLIAFRRYYCYPAPGHPREGVVISDLGPEGVRDPQRFDPELAWPVAWSPDGRLLAAYGPEPTVQPSVIEVDEAGRTLNRFTIRPPSPGCRLTMHAFQAASGSLLVAQQCGPLGSDLQSSYLLLDPRTGAVHKKLLDAPRGYQLLFASFDRSGSHLLYLMMKSNPDGCVTPSRECPVQPFELYRFSDGQSVKIAAGDSAFHEAVW